MVFDEPMHTNTCRSWMAAGSHMNFDHPLTAIILGNPYRTAGRSALVHYVRGRVQPLSFAAATRNIRQRRTSTRLTAFIQCRFTISLRDFAHTVLPVSERQVPATHRADTAAAVRSIVPSSPRRLHSICWPPGLPQGYLRCSNSEFRALSIDLPTAPLGRPACVRRNGPMVQRAAAQWLCAA